MISDAGGGFAILVNHHWNAWEPLGIDHYPGVSEYAEFKELPIFVERCAFNHLTLVLRFIGFDGVLLHLLTGKGLLGYGFAMIHPKNPKRVQVSKI